MKLWWLTLALISLLMLGCSQSPTNTTEDNNQAHIPLVINHPQKFPLQDPAITIRKSVTAVVETEPMPNAGDAADDPAIWVHPTDPGQSTVIVTDKKGGLAVYDLTGKQIQYLSLGRMNNVDIRNDFPLNGKRISLVAANNRDDNSIALYRVDPTSRMLENVRARPLATRGTYGSCMYHSIATNTFYYFVTDHDGTVEQWRIFDNGSGKVDGTKVRTLKLDSQTEGCVADDQLGHLYIAEEDTGIWKFGAEPNTGTTGTLIDTTDSEGNLSAEVEGLAIAYGPGSSGYLFASSQGDNTYAVYYRDGTNAYIGSFGIADGHSIDGVNETDGIDVTSANLGEQFPQGVFIAQDGSNGDQYQNVKLIPLQAIIGKQRASAGYGQ